MRPALAFPLAALLLAACGADPAGGGGGSKKDGGSDAGCTPTTCTAAGKNCGQMPDGCGGTLACGTCPGGQTCGAGGPNVCGTGSCTPTTCSKEGKNCGTISDGCGATLPCGSCAGTQTCGGGGVQNVCGGGGGADGGSDGGPCVKTTCTAQGKDCGPIDDGCGGTLQCGTCSGLDSCGGGGTTGVCGATCPATCPTGYHCDGHGACVGGTPTGLVLDVKAFDVSGTVTLNGAIPQPSSCSYSSGATVTFKEKTQGISFSMSASCPSSGAWVFSGRVYAGTYDVTVTGYYSEIPSTPFLALAALRIP